MGRLAGRLTGYQCYLKYVGCIESLMMHTSESEQESIFVNQLCSVKFANIPPNDL